MGMDFIDKTKGTLKKGWDRSRTKLCEANLLTRFPEVVNRSLLADSVDGVPVAVGDTLIVEFRNDALYAFRELTPAARFRDPPEDVVRMVREVGGCAKGTVANVHDISRTVSITLH